MYWRLSPQWIWDGNLMALFGLLVYICSPCNPLVQSVFRTTFWVHVVILITMVLSMRMSNTPPFMKHCSPILQWFPRRYICHYWTDEIMMYVDYEMFAHMHSDDDEDTDEEDLVYSPRSVTCVL